MRVSKFCVSVAALAFAGATGATPAIATAPEKSKAAAPPPVVVVSADKTAAKKSPPDFGAMLAMFDKLFPPQPDPDPARLALARTSAQSMWPEDAYSKMMISFMGGMFDRVMQMKTSDLAALDSKAKKTPAAAAGPDLSLHDQAAAKDPLFDQRMAAIREAVGDEFGKLSAVIDPRVRDGLARSMARRFDAQQLGDINRFFATPSGRALASQSMQLWVDPDMLRSLFGAMPEMIKLMPDMMQKMKAANDKFPKPPKAPATPAKAEKH
jgi:hypothetical protein